MRHFGQFTVVGYNHKGGSQPFLQIEKEPVEFLGIGPVEVAAGFVGKDHFGPVDQGPGHGHPLLLATREFAGPVMQAFAQSYEFQNLPGPPVGFRLG